MHSTDQQSRPAPEEGGDLPEEERLRDGPMREEIIRMTIEALNARGYPDMSIASINSDPRHRAAFVELLEYCRPLPVIREIIEQARTGRLQDHGACSRA